ncbi:MAG TPA: 4Fe-4S binding protein [Bacteroidales bacterium]|nr:4Fe-4S binding protein [Bacteroidales bacterium]HNZ42505.1 4Fe-4S binding protein [Bacteroidales bacterium]HOH84223.1 4Fe-4S binding protein [Bacteroidales bacterium]HPB25169.1 4Fe-4S binding protein [Bacteroidales bacterium]HQN15720.1 4Fe-4S binding protein [Bacteroidales bacterium]
MALSVTKIKCPQNHRCPLITMCPADAITQTGTGLPVIDNTKCINCGRCLKFCPTGAVERK